ncbi:MAG: hypothetical protein AB1715_03470 [Acidobacteriota bacterium]
MIKAVTGPKVYCVWIEMLRRLVPYGRTHRLSVFVAGMLQYAYELAHEKAESNSRARKIAEIFEYAFESPDGEALKKVVEIAESLFNNAGVRYKRRNRRGEIYSIAEEAAHEFLRWGSMPWEK